MKRETHPSPTYILPLPREGGGFEENLLLSPPLPKREGEDWEGRKERGEDLKKNPPPQRGGGLRRGFPLFPPPPLEGED